MTRSPSFAVLVAVCAGCQPGPLLWENVDVHEAQADAVLQAPPELTLLDVRSVGDLDGDGLDEVALRLSADGELPVRVDLFRGERVAEGGLLTPDAVYASFVGFPNTVAAAGDLDGDGRGELAIGHGEGVAIFSGLGLPGFRDALDATWAIAGHRTSSLSLGAVRSGGRRASKSR